MPRHRFGQHGGARGDQPIHQRAGQAMRREFRGKQGLLRHDKPRFVIEALEGELEHAGGIEQCGARQQRFVGEQDGRRIPGGRVPFNGTLHLFRTHSRCAEGEQGILHRATESQAAGQLGESRSDGSLSARNSDRAIHQRAELDVSRPAEAPMCYLGKRQILGDAQQRGRFPAHGAAASPSQRDDRLPAPGDVRRNEELACQGLGGVNAGELRKEVAGRGSRDS